jgi:hypothetical protein
LKPRPCHERKEVDDISLSADIFQVVCAQAPRDDLIRASSTSSEVFLTGTFVHHHGLFLERAFFADAHQIETTETSNMFTATRVQVATYLLGVCPFSIAFLVFLNSSVSFVITDLIGREKGVGDAVGNLGFADELLALIACPLWGLLSDRIGVRYVCQRHPTQPHEADIVIRSAFLATLSLHWP